jgi:hypothetical protein
MFGMPQVAFNNGGDNGFKGDQVRGFGFLHDGSTDTVFRFHTSQVFNQTNPAGFPIPNPGGFLNGPAGDPERRQVRPSCSPSTATSGLVSRALRSTVSAAAPSNTCRRGS